MNRDTERIVKFIDGDPSRLMTIQNLRRESNNSKDFQQEVKLFIVNILNTEKKFFDYPRDKIEIEKIAEYYF